MTELVLRVCAMLGLLQHSGVSTCEPLLLREHHLLLQQVGLIVVESRVPLLLLLLPGWPHLTLIRIVLAGGSWTLLLMGHAEDQVVARVLQVKSPVKWHTHPAASATHFAG